jgi:hypothetical protein
MMPSRVGKTLLTLAIGFVLIVSEHEISSARPQPDKCSGILHKDKYGLRFGGDNKEGEDICLVNQSDEQKVLAICAIGQFCEINGLVDYCKDSGECVEITNITSVSAADHSKETTQTPRVYILARPPTSQVGLVLNGKYYTFGREPPEVQCDLRYEGGCYWKSSAKIKQITKDIISINRDRDFGCSTNIIPDMSKVLGYESGYGKCTSKGWVPMRND